MWPIEARNIPWQLQLVERWIIAALRHRKFFSIEELNQASLDLRDRINQRPFRKCQGSRASQFAALGQPTLNPLPAEPLDLSQWSRARQAVVDRPKIRRMGGAVKNSHSSASASRKPAGVCRTVKEQNDLSKCRP